MTKRNELRILIVDDEPDNCRNLSDILVDLGYRVDWACDGATALALVRHQPYDVALLDLKMPGMDGLALYREIKRLRAGTVAILITAYASSATAQEVLAAGASQIIAKPVHLPKLLELVDRARDQPLILVVDDDVELCDSLWQIFHEKGYRVALAHNATEAAEQLRETSVQIALIDLRLQGGDGTEVFDLVRKSNRKIRIILITGRQPEMESTVGRVLTEEADAACYKPFDVPWLLETLEHLIRKPE